MTAPRPSDLRTLETRQLLANSACEMQQMAALAASIDDELGCWLEARSDLTPPVEILQRVDLLRQSAECFSLLLSNLTKADLNLPQQDLDTILGGIFLGAMRKNLEASAES